jgi:hypothetical protein
LKPSPKVKQQNGDYLRMTILKNFICTVAGLLLCASAQASLTLQVEDYIVNPGVLGTNPLDLTDNKLGLYTGGGWPVTPSLIGYNTENIPLANVVHIQFTGLAPNYRYALVANMPYPASWDYSYTSAADAVGAGKLTFSTTGIMASTVSDGSGKLSVYIGDLDGGLGYRGIDSFTLTQGIAAPAVADKTVNVDFQCGGNTYSGVGALGIASNTAWNPVCYSGTNLVYADGSGNSGISITTTHTGSASNGLQSNPLLIDWVYSFNAQETITISGLVPNSTVDIAFYNGFYWQDFTVPAQPGLTAQTRPNYASGSAGAPPFPTATYGILRGVTADGTGQIVILDTPVPGGIGLAATIAGMQIAVAANSPPTADAGPDQPIHAGNTVNLNGIDSFDDNTDSTALGYAWTLDSKPSGSTATLNNATTATPSFVADKTGSYIVSLIVTDGGGLSSPADHVTISSQNQAPTAEAGDAQLVLVNGSVALNGNASTDPDGDALTYDWTITYAPAGSTAVLNGSTFATPNFSPDLAGSYTVELSVSDFLGAGTPDTVEITAITAASYAQQNIASAAGVVSALATGDVTTKGNQNALGNFLTQAAKAIQTGDIATAIDKLNQAIERTNGCEANGAPDGNGAGRDWVTSCTAQGPILASLMAARDALTP